jgi:hypothetical protein
MANTPVYGWETPDDTDYVYQGAAAARTTANSIDTTVYSLPQGTKSYVRDTVATLTLTGSEVAFFTSPSFTPVAGRLYLITYTVGDIIKFSNYGDVFIRFRKNNVAGTLLDEGSLMGLNYFPTDGFNGGSFSKTIVATSALLGTTAFVPCVTLQSSTVSTGADNTATQAGTISITDIGPS